MRGVVTLTSSRFLSGIRGWETAIYEAESYPFGYIGPTFIIWKAMSTGSHTSQSRGVSPTVTKSKGNRKREQAKRKDSEIYELICQVFTMLMEEGVSASQPESPDRTTRTIWIRCHPSIFSSILSTLKKAVSLTLDTMKKSPVHIQNAYYVEVVDLRDSTNVFELTGPKSSQVIHGALTPMIANQKDELEKVKQTKTPWPSDDFNI
jgi:ribonuclease P/MRP protein subunit POP1